MNQDLKLRWTKSLLPFTMECQCGKRLEANYELDAGRFLHLSAWCDNCSQFTFEDVVSDKMIPFENTKYDYTIRKTEVEPAMIANQNTQCEKCQAIAIGTFNVIKEIAVPWKKGWGNRAFKRVSGAHHRCKKHIMTVDENVIPLRKYKPHG